jgi:uncharacterized protein YcgI (DUF1989 family)
VTDEVIAPGTGWAGSVLRGQVLDIEQVAGRHGADVLVFGLDHAGERFHAARTRSLHGTAPTVGTVLWSNPPAERPLMTMVADTAPGHDVLYPACTALESELASGLPDHTNCHDIETEALRPWGVSADELPDPLNLWMAGGTTADGAMWWRHTPTGPGDRVSLLAQADVLVCVNPCGSDLFGSWGFEVRPLRVRVRPAAGDEHEWLQPPQPRAGRAPRRRDPRAAPAFATDGLRRCQVQVEVAADTAAALRDLVLAGTLGATVDEVARALVMTWWQEHHQDEAAAAFGRPA